LKFSNAKSYLACC